MTGQGGEIGASSDTLAVVRGSGQSVLRRAAAEGASALAGLLEFALVLAFMLASLAEIGAACVAVRLAAGPIDVTPLAQRLAAEGDAPRIAIERAELSWVRESAGPALGLSVGRVRVLDANDQEAAELRRGSVALLVSGLRQGVLASGAVELDGLRVRMLRGDDGAIRLDSGGASAAGGSFPHLLAQLSRPGDMRAGPLLVPRRVIVHDGRVEIADRKLGAAWVVSDVDLDLQRPAAGGITGMGGADVALDAVHTHVGLRATTDAGGAAQVEATLSPFDPAPLARWAPELAQSAALSGLVTITASADLAPSLSPRRAILHASMGQGEARVNAAPVAVTSGVLDAEATWTGAVLDHFRLGRLQIQLPSPAGGAPSVLVLKGDGARQAGRVRADMALELDRAAFADLPQLWPPGVAKNARKWVVENITAGTAHDGHFAVTLETAESLSHISVTAASGQITGDDLSIHWLRPVPPIEGVHAALSLLSPDVIEIEGQGGHLGALQTHASSVRITGLSGKDQVAAIAVDVTGPIPAVIALLSHPKLKLLSRQKITLANPGGSATAHLTVNLPLENKVDIDSIAIHAAGRLMDARVSAVLAGHDVEQGQIELDVTNDGLKASGRLLAAGIPAQMRAELDFRSGPPSQVMAHVNATGRADARQWTKAGLDTAGLVAGPVGVHIDVTRHRDKQSVIDARAEFKEASVGTGKLHGFGWQKPPGSPAFAAALVKVDGDKVKVVERLDAEGPGLSVHGRSDFANGHASVLHIDRAIVGRTEATGEVRLPVRPGEALRATASGPVLDLSGVVSHKSARPDTKPGDSAPGMPWIADVRFDRVLLAQGAVLGPVNAHAEDDGRRLRAARLQSSGPENILASVVPKGTDRQVTLRADDLGALLRAADITDEVHGGKVHLDGQFDDSRAGSPLSGIATLDTFHVRGAAAFGKILQALTLYGVPDALRGPGLLFTELVAPFRWEHEVLELSEARAFSSSLGLTARGRVDVGGHRVDMQGTIVPAYFFNTLLGRVPLVGKLFSPEQGGGVVAVSYAVRGPLDDPSVSVNPLSALTPGALRGLFKIFE